MLVLQGPLATCHAAAAATDGAHMQSGVSAFLRWKVFEALAQLGCRSLDLTDAALNPVTHFKSQLGGDLELTLQLEAPRSTAFRLVYTTRALVARLKRNGVRQHEAATQAIWTR
jgi:hypothetical protein